MTFDSVIYNGRIVTVNPQGDIVANGAVWIKGGRIAQIASLPPGDIPAATEVIDARGGIVLPGLINTHTHLPMSLFRGLADDLPWRTG